MPVYSEAMKSRMVQKLLGPEARSVERVAAESGISKSALFKWRQEATLSLNTMSPDDRKSNPQTKRPEDWSASAKLAAVIASEQLEDAELGTFLRKEGLHKSQLDQWRQAALEALGSSKPSRADGSQRLIRELQSELTRKNSALAETAALLVLQKKVRAIWGDGESCTTPESEK
jgi:transposase